MQRSLPILVLSAVVGLGAVGCAHTTAPTPAAPAAQTPPSNSTLLAGPTAVLEVHGLSCPLCANNLDKELLRVPGVQGVAVDIGTGMVRIDLADGAKVQRSTIDDAVRRSGFTLMSVR